MRVRFNRVKKQWCGFHTRNECLDFWPVKKRFMAERENQESMGNTNGEWLCAVSCNTRHGGHKIKFSGGKQKRHFSIKCIIKLWN